jgi:hypothetical protein
MSEGGAVPDASAQTPIGELPLPDPVVQHVAIELQTGGACNFTSTSLGAAVTIANRGQGPAGPFAVQLSGSPQQTVAGLEAGRSIRLWFPSSITWVVFVDALDQVLESNEGNNVYPGPPPPIPTLPGTCTPTRTTTTTVGPTSTRTITPTVVQGATLTLMSSATSLELGQTLTVTATFRNDSTGIVYTRPRYRLSADVVGRPVLAPRSQEGIVGPDLAPGESTSLKFTLLAVGPGTVTPSITVSASPLCNGNSCPFSSLERSASGPSITVAQPVPAQDLGLRSFAASSVPGYTGDTSLGYLTSSSARSPLWLTWRPGTRQWGYRVLQLSPSGPQVFPTNGNLPPDSTHQFVSTQNLTGLTCYVLAALGPGDVLLGTSDPLCLLPGSGNDPRRAGIFTMTVAEGGTFQVSYATVNADPPNSRFYWLLGGPVVPAPPTPIRVPAGGPACIASIVRSFGLLFYNDALCTIPGAGSPGPDA